MNNNNCWKPWLMWPFSKFQWFSPHLESKAPMQWFAYTRSHGLGCIHTGSEFHCFVGSRCVQAESEGAWRSAGGETLLAWTARFNYLLIADKKKMKRRLTQSTQFYWERTQIWNHSHLPLLVKERETLSQTKLIKSSAKEKIKEKHPQWNCIIFILFFILFVLDEN